MNDEREAPDNDIWQKVVGDFLAEKTDGVCPVCGEYAEAYDSDEGPASCHFLERYYSCPECGARFIEHFNCVPVSITVGF